MNNVITHEEQAIRTKEFANVLKNNTPLEKLVWVWNEYTDNVRSDDWVFESLEDIADILNDDPVAFAQRVYFGDVQSWNDKYFCFNGYANIVSFNYGTDKNCPIDFDQLAEWLVADEYELYQEFIANNY